MTKNKFALLCTFAVERCKIEFSPRAIENYQNNSVPEKILYISEDPHSIAKLNLLKYIFLVFYCLLM